MPKYFGGTHVEQMIHGRKIAKRLRGDKLYYQAYYPVGTVASNVSDKAFVDSSMAPGVVSNSMVIKDGTLSLSIQMDKVKTGLSFYPPASQKIITFIQPENSYTRSSALDNLIPTKFDVTLTDLKSGNYVTLWSPQLKQYGDGVLKVKYDATTNSLTFEDDRSTVNHANWTNSTAFATGYEPGAWALLIIEKVTAY